MRFGSRLRRRRKTVAITVKSRAFASGQHTESVVYNGLTATRQPAQRDEVATAAGVVVAVTDDFFFDQVNGALPAIEEKHVLYIGTDKFEVMAVQKAGGENNRLKVMARGMR